MRAEETHDQHGKPTDLCPEYGCPGSLLMVEAKDVTDEADHERSLPEHRHLAPFTLPPTTSVDVEREEA